MTSLGVLRFAGSSYSNSAPLIDALERTDPRVRMVYDHPSKLVADLNNGSVDAALIPVAHLFAHPELKMVPGLGVVADGPVRSVLLKCNVPMAQIRLVGRDPASASSNALAKILLEKHFGHSVEMVDFHDAETVDAAVMIGDRALLSKPAQAGDIDLAKVWNEMTGLPFVFAVWAVRAEHPELDRIGQIAHAAYQSGLESIAAIAARYANLYETPVAFWLDYLTHSIRYNLGERGLEAMALFRQFWGLQSDRDVERGGRGN